MNAAVTVNLLEAPALWRLQPQPSSHRRVATSKFTRPPLSLRPCLAVKHPVHLSFRLEEVVSLENGSAHSGQEDAFRWYENGPETPGHTMANVHCKLHELQSNKPRSALTPRRRIANSSQRGTSSRNQVWQCWTSAGYALARAASGRAAR